MDKRSVTSAINGAKGGRKKGSYASHTLEAQEMKKNLIAAYQEKASEINTALLDKAVKGDIPAIKEVHDRVYGKAMQAVEMSGKDGKDLMPQSSTEVIAVAKAFDEWYKKQP